MLVFLNRLTDMSKGVGTTGIIDVCSFLLFVCSGCCDPPTEDEQWLLRQTLAPQDTKVVTTPSIRLAQVSAVKMKRRSTV